MMPNVNVVTGPFYYFCTMFKEDIYSVYNYFLFNKVVNLKGLQCNKTALTFYSTASYNFIFLLQLKYKCDLRLKAQ